MKKMIFVLSIAFLASCKKDYHCSCENVSAQGYEYTSVTGSFQATSKGADKACQQQEVNGSTCKVVPE